MAYEFKFSTNVAKCQYSNPWLPCEHCLTHDINYACLKILGSKADPSRPPPTPIDAVIPHEEVLLLQFLYAENGLKEHIQVRFMLPDIFKKLGAFFGPSIPGSQGLRHFLLSVAYGFVFFPDQENPYYEKFENMSLDIRNLGDFLGAILDSRILLIQDHSGSAARLELSVRLMDRQLVRHRKMRTENIYFTMAPLLFGECILAACLRNRSRITDIMDTLPESILSCNFQDWRSAVKAVCGGHTDRELASLQFHRYIDFGITVLTSTIYAMVKRPSNSVPLQWNRLVTELESSVLSDAFLELAEMAHEGDPSYEKFRLLYILLLQSLAREENLVDGILSDEVCERTLDILEYLGTFLEWVHSNLKYEAEIVLEISRIFSVLGLVLLKARRSGAINGTFHFLSTDQNSEHISILEEFKELVFRFLEHQGEVRMLEALRLYEESGERCHVLAVLDAPSLAFGYEIEI